MTENTRRSFLRILGIGVVAAPVVAGGTSASIELSPISAKAKRRIAALAISDLPRAVSVNEDDRYYYRFCISDEEIAALQRAYPDRPVLINRKLPRVA